MLPTRFTFTGENGSDPWWDFQTDGYGMWLWAAVTHARRHGVDPARWRAGFEVAVDYLLTSWDRPCYDWWEEHVEHRHVSTLGAIRGGLVAVADLLDADRARRPRAVAAAEIHALVLAEGVADGHLTKWLGSSAVDGSLPSCVVPFGLVDGGAGRRDARPRWPPTWTSSGGVHRFTADVFYGGGQWLLLSALLGWNLAARGDLDGALRYLRWIAAQADVDGELPEQVPHHLLHPGSRDEWIARWGPVANAVALVARHVPDPGRRAGSAFGRHSMITHRPYGVEHPYATSPDQRVPVLPMAGESVTAGRTRRRRCRRRDL